MKYKLAFGAAISVYLLVCFAVPQADLDAWALYLVPPFVVALVFLAWKAELL